MCSHVTGPSPGRAGLLLLQGVGGEERKETIHVQGCAEVLHGKTNAAGTNGALIGTSWASSLGAGLGVRRELPLETFWPVCF